MTLRIRKALVIAATLMGLAVLPAAAQAAVQHITWKTDNRLEPVSADGFAGVACPSYSACVAVDESGRVVYTSDPRGGVKKWHYATVDKHGGGMAGISCPTTKLCVAVDQSGNALYSTSPLGGSKKWSRPVRIDSAKLPGGTYAGLAAIHCPTTKLCVAVDSSTSGGLVYTTDPTGGASAWHRVSLGSNLILDTVHCASSAMCVVGGTREYYSTNPAGGAKAWHLSGAYNGADVASLTCPTVSLCVGAGTTSSDDGVAFTSTAPTKVGWARTNVVPQIPASGTGLFDSVACANKGFCIALDSNDRAYTTIYPSQHKWSAGKEIRKNAVASRSVIFCRGYLCIAMDSRGVEETGIVSG